MHTEAMQSAAAHRTQCKCIMIAKAGVDERRTILYILDSLRLIEHHNTLILFHSTFRKSNPLFITINPLKMVGKTVSEMRVKTSSL